LLPIAAATERLVRRWIPQLVYLSIGLLGPFLSPPPPLRLLAHNRLILWAPMHGGPACHLVHEGELIQELNGIVKALNWTSLLEDWPYRLIVPNYLIADDVAAAVGLSPHKAHLCIVV